MQITCDTNNPKSYWNLQSICTHFSLKKEENYLRNEIDKKKVCESNKILIIFQYFSWDGPSIRGDKIK